MKRLYVLQETGGDGFLNEFVLVIAESLKEATDLIGDRSEFLSEDAKVTRFHPIDYSSPQIIYDLHKEEMWEKRHQKVKGD